MSAAPPRASLSEIALVALWFGVAGFGGGYVVMQRVRRVVVDERAWMSETEFLDALSVATSLPGTVATNLLTVLGLRFSGLRGALAAAVCFLVPSVSLMVAFAIVYDPMRRTASVGAFLDGMCFATVGVVAAAAIDLGRTALKRPVDWALAALALGLLATHVVSLFVVVLMAAAFGAIALRPRTGGDGPTPSVGSSLGAVPAFLSLATLPAWLALFTVFAKIGLVTFGGGFAMIPALERETVHDHHWLGVSAFNDAMVLGQVTPGPVAVAATFIGYRVSGLFGSMVATLGMFGPPFVLAVLAGRSAEIFRERPSLRGALASIAPALVGIVAASAVALFRTTVHSPVAGIVAAGALAMLVVRRTLSPLVPLGLAGAVGLALSKL